MSEHVPDSYDPTQPDLPTLAVDPDPETASGEEGQDTRHFPRDITDDPDSTEDAR